MATKIENVVIQAGECTVTLLPSLGGKVSSIRVGPNELLQAPLNPYALRTRTMGFADSDASGWDECLPSVAECTVDLETGPTLVPDHGDLWRVPWTIVDASPDSATLSAACFSLPLEITRSIFVAETLSGWRISVIYTLSNRSAQLVPWSWAAHPLFVCQPGDRVLLPDSVHTLRLEGSGKNRLGLHGDTIQWPVAQLPNGEMDDLSIAKDPSTGIGDKLFAGPFASNPSDSNSTQQDWCALERPSVGLRITFRFAPEATPYIGMWLCYGGWPDNPGPKQVCVALEPATAPVDSLAEVGSWSRTLAPGETFTWPMELEINRISQESN